MNTRLKKKMIRFIVAGMVFFTAGFGLMFLYQDPEQEIIKAAIENQQIENTPFYVTYNDDMNNKFAAISIDRLKEVFEENNKDFTSMELLGKEVHELLEQVTNTVNSFFDSDPDNMEPTELMYVTEEYFQHFKNLKILRALDREIDYRSIMNDRDYDYFFDKPENTGNGDGKFELIYEKPQNPRLLRYYRALNDSNIFEKMIEAINSKFYFDQNYEIRFVQGQEINAFYSPTTRRITVSYELMDFIFTMHLNSEIDAISESESKLAETVFFIILHEMGHAFIDIFNLQHTGKEEDVADHLSIVLTVELIGEDHPDLVEILFNFPLFFNYMLENSSGYLESLEEATDSEKTSWSTQVYSDVHSLDFQRIIDIISLIHGLRPIETEYLVSNNANKKYKLMEMTAKNSPDIYLDTSNFWYNALYPHFR